VGLKIFSGDLRPLPALSRLKNIRTNPFNLPVTVHEPPILPFSGFHGAGATAVSLSGCSTARQHSVDLIAREGFSVLATRFQNDLFGSEKFFIPGYGQTNTRPHSDPHWTTWSPKGGVRTNAPKGTSPPEDLCPRNFFATERDIRPKDFIAETSESLTNLIRLSWVVTSISFGFIHDIDTRGVPSLNAPRRLRHVKDASYLSPCSGEYEYKRRLPVFVPTAK